MKAILFLLSLLIYFGGASASAQVVTPSLDQLRPTLVSAASSWRFGSTVGAGSQYGWSYNSTTKVNGHSQGLDALVAWQTARASLEVSGTQNRILDLWDPSSDTYGKETISESRFGLAIRGDGRVSVGIGGHNETLKGNILRQRKAFGGSFNVRLGEGFFLGGGLEKVSEMVSGYEDKRWNRVFSGAAYQYGTPESNQFRVEYDLIIDKGDSNGVVPADLVAPKKTQTYSVEAKFGFLILTYQDQTVTETKILNWGTERVQKEARYGLGLRGSSFSMSLYRMDGKELRETKDQVQRAWSLNFGFHFI